MSIEINDLASKLAFKLQSDDPKVVNEATKLCKKLGPAHSKVILHLINDEPTKVSDKEIKSLKAKVKKIEEGAKTSILKKIINVIKVKIFRQTSPSQLKKGLIEKFPKALEKPPTVIPHKAEEIPIPTPEPPQKTEEIPIPTPSPQKIPDEIEPSPEQKKPVQAKGDKGKGELVITPPTKKKDIWQEWHQTLEADGSKLANAPDEIKRDKLRVLQAIKTSPEAIKAAHKDLQKDVGFLEAAINENPEVYNYLDPEMKAVEILSMMHMTAPMSPRLPVIETIENKVNPPDEAKND